MQSLHVISKKRLGFASFLNLLVLPGTGSFVIYRRLDGFVQLGMSLLAMVFFGLSSKALLFWVFGLYQTFLQTYDSSGGSAPPFVTFLDSFLLGYPAFGAQLPTVFGFSSLSVFITSLVIFVLVWVYSLITILIVMFDNRVKRHDNTL
jgi:hypothetical protein